MSRSLTGKAVDKFVEATNDRTFSPHLYSASIMAEDSHTQRVFFDTILHYLGIMARQYANKIDYFGTQDIASMCYHLYNAYLEKGGSGEPLSPDLNRFDNIL
jgi:hypothetical protein